MALSNARGGPQELPGSDRRRRVSSASRSTRSFSPSSFFPSEAARMSLSFATLCVLFFLQQVWLQGLLRSATVAGGDHRRDLQPSGTTRLRHPSLLPTTDTSPSGTTPGTDRDGSSSSPSPSPYAAAATPGAGSFLIYVNPAHNGQGTGNIMSGVLAATLLGEEFGRTVCIAGYEHSFGRAFRWGDPSHRRACERALFGWREQQQQQQNPPPPASSSSPSSAAPSSGIPPMDPSNTIVQNNFDQTAIQSECAMKELLSNHQDYPVLYYKGNTYPRWPTRKAVGDHSGRGHRHDDADSTSRDIFHQYFEPTPALLKLLPWNVDDPPAVVVHLRQGDSVVDTRDGLDEQTLSLLASYNFSADLSSSSSAATSSSSSSGTSFTAIGGSAFLVTNRVDWYERFSQWSHPPWSLVHHSALPTLAWGTARRTGDRGKRGPTTTDLTPPMPVPREEETLQMWADWYALLRAQRVYHTHSDYSASAARWNQRVACWTIRGTVEERDVGGGRAATAAAANGDPTPTAGHPLRLVLTRDFQEEEEAGGGVVVRRLADRTEGGGGDLKYCDPSQRAADTKAFEDMRLKQTLALMQGRRRQRQNRKNDVPSPLRGGGGGSGRRRMVATSGLG